MALDQCQHFVIFGHGRKRQFMEIAQPCFARAKVAHSQFADHKRMYQNLLGFQQLAQSWNFATGYVSPKPRYRRGSRRLQTAAAAPALNSGSLPPKQRQPARRLALDQFLSAWLNQRRLLLHPGIFLGLASNSSSRATVVRIGISFEHRKIASFDAVFNAMPEPHSLIRSSAAISPITPRRNSSTQSTKITPWITVTHSPTCAR